MVSVYAVTNDVMISPLIRSVVTSPCRVTLNMSSDLDVSLDDVTVRLVKLLRAVVIASSDGVGSFAGNVFDPFT